MTPAEQRDIARRMRASEERARALVHSVRPMAVVPPGRTCARQVDALEAAVAALWAEAQVDASLMPAARRAREAMAESATLRGDLALTGQRIALWAASRYGGNLDDEDRRQEALLGLMEAAKRYDPDAPAAFTTYALWWARATVSRAAARVSSEVVVPLATQARLRDANRLFMRARGRGREITVEETADALGVDPLAAAVFVQGVTGLDDVASSRGRPSARQRLWHEEIPDPLAVAEDAHVAHQDAQGTWLRVRKAMRALPRPQERAIVLRWLHGRGVPEVARRLGVSEADAKRIEREGMVRLREALGGEGWSRPPLDVVAMLRRRGRSRARDLYREAGGARLYDALERAVRRGEVRRVAHGVYEAADPTPAQGGEG